RGAYHQGMRGLRSGTGALVVLEAIDDQGRCAVPLDAVAGESEDARREYLKSPEVVQRVVSDRCPGRGGIRGERRKSEIPVRELATGADLDPRHAILHRVAALRRRG